VLIGAGDGRFLALVQILALAVFAAAAWLVARLHGGLVALWCALGLFMVVRLALLAARARGGAWLVTGTAR
jgi:Na+-driven multidrug efflux pump